MTSEDLAAGSAVRAIGSVEVMQQSGSRTRRSRTATWVMGATVRGNSSDVPLRWCALYVCLGGNPAAHSFPEHRSCMPDAPQMAERIPLDTRSVVLKQDASACGDPNARTSPIWMSTEKPYGFYFLVGCIIGPLAFSWKARRRLARTHPRARRGGPNFRLVHSYNPALFE